MTEIATPKTRYAWTHRNAIRLSQAYTDGGLAEAKRTFPDRSEAELERKLDSLGLGPALSADEDVAVGAFVAAVRKSSHPKVMARLAIDALREIARG